MIALTKNLNENLNILLDQHNYTIQRIPKEELIMDTIIDSFNEQIYLNNQFKQKIRSVIGSIEYINSTDKFAILKTIDLFLESLHTLSTASLKKNLDSLLITASQEENKRKTLNSFCVPSEVSTTMHNSLW